MPHYNTPLLENHFKSKTIPENMNIFSTLVEGQETVCCSKPRQKHISIFMRKGKCLPISPTFHIISASEDPLFIINLTEV